MSTLVASNLQASGGGGTAAMLASINGGPISGARNRIINGDMRIDQRNAGASVTVTDNGYTLDRWSHRMSGSGIYTAQRDTTVPTGQGFTNSLKLTVTTADASIATTDVYSCLYKIEGFNTADLGWGASGAASATLSFWVRSSQTGTYSVAFLNSDANRGYAVNYSISAANTWEYKTITVPGDTTGTWGSGNGIGIQVSFCLGCGTDRTEPAGAWTAANVQGADSTFNWMATNGATFYITGVQLEAGSVATPFERRSYGQELMLAQRYFQFAGSGAVGCFEGTTTIQISEKFFTPMRAAPTAGIVSGVTAAFRHLGTDFTAASPSLANFTSNSAGAGCPAFWTQVSGFTGGTSGVLVNSRNQITTNAGQFISLSAEL